MVKRLFSVKVRCRGICHGANIYIYVPWWVSRLFSYTGCLFTWKFLVV